MGRCKSCTSQCLDRWDGKYVKICYYYFQYYPTMGAACSRYKRAGFRRRFSISWGLFTYNWKFGKATLTQFHAAARKVYDKLKSLRGKV